MTHAEAIAAAIENLSAAQESITSSRGNWEQAKVRALIGQGYANVALALPYEEEDDENVG